jgi:hypothetical protein
MTKLDEVAPLLPVDSRLLHSPPAGTRVNAKEVRQCSDEVAGALAAWDPAAAQLLRQRFPTATYFAVSALGRQPASDGTLPRPLVPVGVGSLLAWLLSRCGVERLAN